MKRLLIISGISIIPVIVSALILTMFNRENTVKEIYICANKICEGDTCTVLSSHNTIRLWSETSAGGTTMQISNTGKPCNVY